MKIVIDGNYMKSKRKTHSYLKKKLNLPDYYGENLDALWDILSTWSDKLNIRFINEYKAREYLDLYGRDLVELFKEAAEENPNIEIEIKNY